MKDLIGTLRFLGAVVASLFFAASAIITIPLNPAGKLFHANARLWAKAVLSLCGIRVHVTGLRNLALPGNHVYVANHASMFDIPAIVAGIPDEIRIVYKKELEWIPLFGWGLKWGPYVGIDRSGGAKAMKSLDDAARKIRSGASILLYAEGTRTLDGRLQPFKRGAFHLAVQSGVPVVPLTVNGSFHILRKHSFVVRPGTVELVLDTPIALEGITGKDAEIRLMDQVHTAIRKHYIDQ
jgi:1-acyl-sn-glycerol-3-phosphate acyltransferase